MRFSNELCAEIQRLTNGERYDFYAERVNRGFLGVDDADVHFGIHRFRGNVLKHCLIVEIPTLISKVRDRSHHSTWYYVKH